MKNRVDHVDFLDALRGIAILGVLLCHTYAKAYAYGDEFSAWHGWFRTFSTNVNLRWENSVRTAYIQRWLNKVKGTGLDIGGQNTGAISADAENAGQVAGNVVYHKPGEG